MSVETGCKDAGDRSQKTIKCKVKVYRISNMQRCPYIHEMKERLLGEQIPMEPLPKKVPEPPPFIMDQQQLLQQQPVATVVRLNSDGYGSHTSPTHYRTERTPLMSKDPEDDDPPYVDRSMFPKNAKTSLFIIMSFVYAKLLIVVCVAYVISDVVTHNIPLYYYEGFFTYLYGMSILFLLYVFCFLLQESTCCSGEKKEKVKKPVKEKVKEKEMAKEKKKEEEKKKKEEKDKQKKDKEKDKDKDKDKKSKKQDKEQAPASTADVEAGTVTRSKRKRKTTQNDQSHGSFFLRIGAIAFGLGTMIYNGLEFGAFFEVPFTSPCYMILRGVNPVLQMVFTFMQMYFIFMNSRLNIHRFKVIARFGLMHVVATNICVWIRTLVLEYLKEITTYHKRFNVTHSDGGKYFAESIKLHNLRNANGVLGTHLAVPDVIRTTVATITSTQALNYMRDVVNTTARTTTTTLKSVFPYANNPSTRRLYSSSTTPSTTTLLWKIFKTTPTTPTTPAPTIFNPTTTTRNWNMWKSFTTPLTNTPFAKYFDSRNFNNLQGNVANVFVHVPAVNERINGTEFLDDMFKQPLLGFNFFGNRTTNSTMALNMSMLSCGRVNIMGTIVQDSAPYLFPFIIEYSLIGAAVIYVMWKHIGRNPRYTNEEDLEHRLEIMLSRRAVAMAHAQQGRVDCVGASKGLFFGLLMLVGSLICLILFFVLIHHPDLGLLAIYLADVSHCVLMVLSIIAIIVGFIRVQSLKFKTEEQSDLNDILLRVSAFGLFTYAVFSVIAGSLNAFTREPNLLVMITGILSIAQVVLQLLFIADVSRRRVHLPEHDRSKPGRQVVTFLLICNVTMWIIYTFEAQKVEANPVQLEFYGFLAWAIVQRFTLPLCIFHRFHSAVTLAEIWKTSYKARLE